MGDAESLNQVNSWTKREFLCMNDAEFTRWPLLDDTSTSKNSLLHFLSPGLGQAELDMTPVCKSLTA